VEKEKNLMASAGPYSELEYLILAMVGEGVNSGYAMRKEMNRMRGGRWSAESGSVYRVLRRLDVDGLVSLARKVGVPNRERTEYELTRAGEALLNSWLTFPPDRTELGFLVDPIRTRSYFLPRLSHAEQGRVIKTWMQENRRFIDDLEREVAVAGDHPLRKIAYQNLMFLAQARQEWLKKMLATHKTLSAAPVAESNPVS
jgi:DNA-binding PadR family transcriptional regulator